MSSAPRRHAASSPARASPWRLAGRRASSRHPPRSREVALVDHATISDTSALCLTSCGVGTLLLLGLEQGGPRSTGRHHRSAVPPARRAGPRRRALSSGSTGMTTRALRRRSSALRSSIACKIEDDDGDFAITKLAPASGGGTALTTRRTGALRRLAHWHDWR